MDKNLKKLIGRVSKVCDIAESELLTLDNKKASLARKMLIHTAKSLDYSYKTLASEFDMAYGVVAKNYISAEVLLERGDAYFIRHINVIRKKSGLSAIIDYSRPKKKPKKLTKSHYMPFVKFNPEEEYQIYLACLSAAKYMQNYGKGIEPLLDGFATQRKNDKKEFYFEKT